MGTDENTTESARFARVRGRLSAPEIGGVGTSTVRDRLPSLGIEGVQSIGLRERLPTPELDGDRSGMRERLSGSGIRGRLAAPTVRTRLPEPRVRDRLPDANLSERLALRDVAGGTSSVSLPDPEALGPPESVEQRLRDSQTTTPEYFVGVIPASHETVCERLGDSSLGRSYVTYPKVLTDEERGLKREAESVWVYRSWSLAHFQLHVPLFEVPGEEAVYVFYHHEYNWLRHPVEHLDATYLNPEFERDQLVDLLESAGLELQCCPEVGDGFPVAAAYCNGGEAA